MATSDRNLKHVKLNCAREAAYPKHCLLKATDTSRGNRPVAGTVRVLGIDTKTGTYAYQILYGPIHH